MSQFPTSFVMQRANLKPLAPSDYARFRDPLPGVAPHSHGELAIRIANLREHQRRGFDVADEMDALISGWEAHR